MREWLIGERTYEGFPLLLRRPVDLDIEVNRFAFPDLLSVTHEFARRLENGLPEPQYNKTLEDVDHELLVAFDLTGDGVPVLVETYGGERNYYFYVKNSADIEQILNEIKNRHSNEKLSWSIVQDTEWKFIKKYAKDFF